MPLWGGTTGGDRPSVKVGRLHEGQVELHRNGGDKTGPYWYQGNVRVLEEQVRTTADLSAELRDPLNQLTLGRINQGLSDDQIVQEELAYRIAGNPGWGPSKLEVDAALGRIARLRYLASRSHDQHVVRLYSLDRAGKSEERILAFIDQDPLKEAPQKRFTDTEKGWRHKQLVTFGCMAFLDAIFLWGMISFASAPVSTGAQAQQVSVQAFSNLAYILIAAGWISTVLALYMWMARRTLVSSWEIQPIKQLGLDTHSEAVYLQNSQAAPASEYLARILGYDADTISDYALAVAKLPVDAMSTMQEQVEAQRRELDTVQTKAIEQGAMTASLKALGMRRPATVYEAGINPWLVVLITGSIVAVVAVAVILAAGG
jgi:ribulose bisphosphate carboxylase small subunit